MRNRLQALCAALAAVVMCTGAGLASATPVDGFEAGLPTGVAINDTPNTIRYGFSTFAGIGTSVISTTSSPPAPVPGAVAGNTVLKLDVEATDFAGFVHVFENTTAGTLAPQDWSAFDALTFWLYGNNTGIDLYIDLLDNRGGPDAFYPFELWTSTFKDDFSGWKQLSFAFSSLVRKDIANGAPNDGLGLTAVHGWALGTLGTGGARTYFVDDVRLASSVPEPGTLPLFGFALLGMLAAAHRRRRGP